MSKRKSTRASTILAQSQARIDRTQSEYDAAVASISVIATRLEAYKDVHRDLVVGLAVKPRGENGSPKSSSTSAPAAGRKSSRARAVASQSARTEELVEPAGTATTPANGSESEGVGA